MSAPSGGEKSMVFGMLAGQRVGKCEWAGRVVDVHADRQE